ncbi:MAG: DNA-directed RNA polymerase subunit RpoH/Rpb5 C-terminal domain-containing protein [Candidatus ainarchaeum sp.]|nr:DNA-directed RNA polymerase subunit RpoH/Rpb5 C-terminal domain-containing protein [Candidatus ainarchaeum sp.]
MKKPTVPTVDVLSHHLIPEMKVLGEAEKAKVLKRYGVTEDQLPKMFSTDPAAVALKAKAGDVIRIERNDGTVKYPGYRVVVED